MKDIPILLRDELDADPAYSSCARRHAGNCAGDISRFHAMLYEGKPIQEKWAIVPLCEYHGFGDGADGGWNISYAMNRATDFDMKKYPKIRWGR